MTLDGNLRDFGLEGIFQLINAGKKTGTLHIVRKNGEAEAFIYFRKGRIFGAVSNYNRQPIGERLVNAGQLTEEQLGQALEAQRQSKQRQRIGQILISQGLITEEVLKAFVKEQIQNTVFDLLPWTEGEFEFFAGELPATEDMGLLVSAKRFFAKGSRRLDRWDKIREKVPSAEAVFRVATDAGERLQQSGLAPGYLKLLRLVDGESDVTQLAFAVQVSEYEVSSMLFELATMGLIEPVQASTEALAAKSPVTEVASEDQETMPVSEIQPPVTEAGAMAEPEEEEPFDHFELTPDELISGRAGYVGELVALTDGRRAGPRTKFTLPATSAAVLAERVHLDRKVAKEKIEAIMRQLKE